MMSPGKMFVAVIESSFGNINEELLSNEAAWGTKIIYYHSNILENAYKALTIIININHTKKDKFFLVKGTHGMVALKKPNPIEKYQNCHYLFLILLFRIFIFRLDDLKFKLFFVPIRSSHNRRA